MLRLGGPAASPWGRYIEEDSLSAAMIDAGFRVGRDGAFRARWLGVAAECSFDQGFVTLARAVEVGDEHAITVLHDQITRIERFLRSVRD